MKTRAALVVGIATGLLAYGWWVINAPTTEHPSGDAVMLHAGGRNDRLPHALQLMTDGAAGVLVIMRGDTPTWTAAQQLCGQVDPFEVVCPLPEPDSTIGEARGLRTLAEDRGWSKVVVVTSDYHLRRATLLDRRCSPGLEIQGSASASQLGPWPLLVRTAKEMAGMVQASLVTC